jgi:hypothetical protein
MLPEKRRTSPFKKKKKKKKREMDIALNMSVPFIDHSVCNKRVFPYLMLALLNCCHRVWEA